MLFITKVYVCLFGLYLISVSFFLVCVEVREMGEVKIDVETEGETEKEKERQLREVSIDSVNFFLSVGTNSVCYI